MSSVPPDTNYKVIISTKNKEITHNSDLLMYWKEKGNNGRNLYRECAAQVFTPLALLFTNPEWSPSARTKSVRD